ncbi:MAG: hypothetical protein ABIR19_07610 [Ginsengibacter sp.]
MPLSSRKEVTVFVHKKLLFRLRRLAIFFLVAISFLGYEIAKDGEAFYFAILGILMGILIGYVAGNKMHSIKWDNEAMKVVSKMDRVGIVVLVIYILFSISRRWIFSHWLTGNLLTTFILAISCGTISSRLWFVRRKIRETLKREGFLYPSKKMRDTAAE